jgi:hypothetical protein
MSSANEFHQLALECARWAEETREPGQREILIELTNQCRDLGHALGEAAREFNITDPEQLKRLMAVRGG